MIIGAHDRRRGHIGWRGHTETTQRTHRARRATESAEDTRTQRVEVKYAQTSLPVRHVLLDGLVVVLAANEALGIEDGVRGVARALALGSCADEVLIGGERDAAYNRSTKEG